jgi:hypothetical protein
MAFLLDRDLAAVPDPDRYLSMSVTRNAAAVVASPAKPVRMVRPVNALDDIDGARPRTLPPHQRATFHGTGDIDGAAPRVLHASRTLEEKVDRYGSADIDGECVAQHIGVAAPLLAVWCARFSNGAVPLQ